MEQGYQQVPRRVASGYFSLIFFIVLCLALIGGYVPIVLMLQQKAQDLKTINALIDQQLVQPISGQGETLRTSPPTEGTTLRYQEDFFTDVRTLAEGGIKYKELVALVGEPDPQKLKDKLTTNATGQRQTDLWSLVGDLERRFTTSQGLLDQVKKSLATAQAERKRVADSLATERKAYEQQIAKLTKQIQEERRIGITRTEEYKKKWDDAHQAHQKAVQDWIKQQRQLNARITQLEKTREKLEQEIADLRKQFIASKPVVKEGALGEVLRVDLVHEFVIINRGERDGLEAGKELLVYRPVRGGEWMNVGRVVVVKVEKTVSRADISQYDPKVPILRGDRLYTKPPR